MRIDNILSNKNNQVQTIAPDTPVHHAVKLLRHHKIGALIVSDQDAVVGMLSERDIVRGLAENSDACLNLAARDLMSHPVITCTREDTVDSAMSTMTERRFRHMPVLENGLLIGTEILNNLIPEGIGLLKNDPGTALIYLGWNVITLGFILAIAAQWMG